MSLEECLLDLSVKRRVFPLPNGWQRVYEMLPEVSRSRNGWEPPLPLILGAWHESSDDQKFQRFKEHITWADSKGNLQEILEFLRSIPEDGWLHYGE